MTTATTIMPTTVRMLTKCRTSQQDVAAVSPVDVYAREWEWPEKILRGSGVDGQVLKQSGGVKEVRKQSGVKEVLKQSGGVKEVLKQSGVKEVQKQSGGVKEVLKGSGEGKEVLKQSGGVKEVLKQSGGVKEILKQSGEVEVSKGPKTVRDGLKGGFNLLSEEKDAVKGSGVAGKVMKGSEGVEDVLERFGVEPHRIFETFFHFDK